MISPLEGVSPDRDTLMVGLFATLISGCLIWILYARLFHPFAEHPGPFLASVSRSWITWRVIRGDLEKSQRELHAKYGHIIRIAPNEVSISDPAAIKAIYSVNSGFTKTDFYPPSRPAFARFPDHFTSTDEKIHQQRRKIVSNIYSMSNIVQSEVYIDKCTELFMSCIDEFAQSKQSFDLAKWFQMFSFDVIGELYFNKMFGFLKNKGDYQRYLASLETLIPIIVIASVIPNYLRPVFFGSGVLFSSVRKALRSSAKLDSASESCVNERLSLRESGKQTRDDDILAKLLDIHLVKGEKVDFNVRDIKQEVYTALFAGSDTTSIALSSILYHLMKSPAAYKKLVDEIDEATVDGSLSQPSVRYSEAAKLPYLSACIKEGMRVHPSVGFTLPRYVPEYGCEIAGKWFRGGSRVGVNAAVVHFDRNIFGDDADMFNPDRWFRPGVENLDKHMFQFGGGSRICIGKHISLCEIYKIIPQLLRTYRLELTDPQKEWTTLNRWFNKPSGVNVIPQRRTLTNDPRTGNV